MIFKIFKFFHHSTLVVLEILGGFFLLGVAGIGILMWKFSAGPIDVTFAAQQVRDALIVKSEGTDLRFQSIMAEWPDFAGPISIGLSGLELTQNGQTVLKVPQLGVRIARLPLFIGKVKPEAIVADAPSLHLQKRKDGSVHLLILDNAEETMPVQNDAPTITARQLGESFFKGGNLPDYPALQPLSQLQKISIRGARIHIENQMIGKSWDIPKIDFDMIRAKDTFEITTTYTDEAAPADSPVSSLRVEVSRRQGQDDSIRIVGDAEKVNLTTWVRLFGNISQIPSSDFYVDGHIDGMLNQEWELQSLLIDLLTDKGELKLDGLYESPLSIGNLSAKIHFDKEKGELQLHDTALTVNGIAIRLQGEKKLASTDKVYPLTVTADKLTFDQLQALWPQAAKDTVLADWLTHRLSEGVVKNLRLTLPVDFSNPDMVDVTKIGLQLDYTNLTADYLPPLIPATNGKGTVTLADDTLTINVASANLDKLSASNSKISITHLAHPTTIGDVVIDANLHGPLATYIDYIGREPISLKEKVGFKPEEVKGNADAKIRVTLPCLKDLPMEQVKIAVDATANDVFLPRVTKGMNLTGGPMTIKVSDDDFVVAGKGNIGSVPLDFTYQAYLDLAKAPYVSAVTASLNADKNLRHAFGVDVDRFIDGAVPITVDYKDHGKAEIVNIKGDLTPVRLTLGPIRYMKPVGKAGNVSAHVSIANGNVQRVEKLDIQVKGEGGFAGDLDFGKIGNVYDVTKGDFPRVTIGGKNDFSLSFRQTKPNYYDAVIKGKSFDARGFLKSQNDTGAATTAAPASTAEAKIDLNVTQMRTGDKDDQFLKNATMTLQVNGQGDIRSMKLQGGLPHGDVSMSLLPDSKGRMKLSIKSGNAGEALHVMDVYSNMVGGVLEIGGMQMDNGGINDIKGKIYINKFTVVRAPALAKLINLFSLSGLGELLNNKGITFDKLRGDFVWQQTPAGRVINIQGGRASGPSLGLTFGGIVNQSKGNMDMTGTIVPMSEVNGLLSNIPLIGQLLTGGKNGGIIAATYAMKGKTDDPSVLVNPLSVLTPGFLRTILWEDSSSTSFDDDGETTPTPPKKRAVNN
jgi:hypothetical protein